MGRELIGESLGLARIITGSIRREMGRLLEPASQIPHSMSVMEPNTPKDAIKEQLQVHVERLETFITNVESLAQRTFAPRLNPTIFIGHGRSPVWREVKDFITDRLRLPCEEFNRQPVAGTSTHLRIDQMLTKSAFALLVMTPEDEHGDGKLHARENVVHEVGLFQGRLGSNRAIILQDTTCVEFSNIAGLSTLRFPTNHVSATFDGIRQVLEREGLT